MRPGVKKTKFNEEKHKKSIKINNKYKNIISIFNRKP